jgi:hypothetical protein
MTLAEKIHMLEQISRNIVYCRELKFKDEETAKLLFILSEDNMANGPSRMFSEIPHLTQSQIGSFIALGSQRPSFLLLNLVNSCLINKSDFYLFSIFGGSEKFLEKLTLATKEIKPERINFSKLLQPRYASQLNALSEAEVKTLVLLLRDAAKSASYLPLPPQVFIDLSKTDEYRTWKHDLGADGVSSGAIDTVSLEVFLKCK